MNPYLIFLSGGVAALAIAGLLFAGIGYLWARAGFDPARTRSELDAAIEFTSLLKPAPENPVPPQGGSGTVPVSRLPKPYDGPTLIQNPAGEPFLVVTKIGDLIAAGCLFGGPPTWGRA